MPSPFPGMDPYLEGSQWMSVHSALSIEIARQLAPRVPERYVVRPNERMVTITPEVEGRADEVGTMYPDAFVVDAGTLIELPGAAAGGQALMPAPLLLATVIPVSIPHVTVEIHDVAGRELVAAIEVLSPTNKRGEGRTEYLAKRRRVLLSEAHLVEIDLLRAGQRVPMRNPLPSYPYFALVGRSEKRPETDVWPIRLDQPIPAIPIPLLPGDADVSLDLQAALTSVYDTFRFDRTIDYTRPPEVPLRPRQLAALA